MSIQCGTYFALFQNSVETVPRQPKPNVSVINHQRSQPASFPSRNPCNPKAIACTKVLAQRVIGEPRSGRSRVPGRSSFCGRVHEQAPEVGSSLLVDLHVTNRLDPVIKSAAVTGWR